jgi:heme-degrading monooxygenase HmoA
MCDDHLFFSQMTLLPAGSHRQAGILHRFFSVHICEICETLCRKARGDHAGKMFAATSFENSNLLKTIVMIIVHDIVICKPGNASKVAKMFKEAMAGNEELVNIMTDMTGQFNKVVMVSKYDSLAAFEESWKKYEQNSDEMKKMREKMAGYTDMYLTGSREIYKVW